MIKVPFLLGVDGGGTTTIAWVSDTTGHVLGRGRSGPSNSKAVGLQAARRSLVDAIEQARDEAQVAKGAAEVACLGLAGFDRPDDKVHLEAWSRELGWARRLVLVNDGDLLLAAGTPEGWGIGLISGTGSIAVGRSPSKQATRAGGWGHLIGDEGSAYWVALQALRAIARAADGRSDAPAPADPLTLRLLEDLGVTRELDLVSVIYQAGMDRSRIARLAPRVVEAAEEGSPYALQILDQAASELACAVLAVYRNLELAGKPQTVRYPLVLAGGFLLATPMVCEKLLAALEVAGCPPSAVTPVPDPVFGALTLARRSYFT